jgi:hypothetical protein
LSLFANGHQGESKQTPGKMLNGQSNFTEVLFGVFANIPSFSAKKYARHRSACVSIGTIA